MPALPSIYTKYDSRYQNPMFNQTTGAYGYNPSMANTSGISGTGSASALPGSTAFGYTPEAGGIPQVPNPVTTAGQAIAGNQGNLGQIGQLATGIGGINAKLGALPYQQNLPNYQGLLGQASTNALQNLQGQVPQDVLRQIQQGAAERGVYTGAPGGPNSNAAYLRALGLTSLGQQQTGLSQFGNLMGLTPTGPSFNPASMFITPGDVQSAQAAANLYNSAPIPSYAQNAAFNALQNGLRQGRGATGGGGAANPNLDLVGSIIGKYGPTVGGTPAMPSSPIGGSFADQPISDQDWYDLIAGDEGYQSQGDYQYQGDVTTGNTVDASSPDYWNFDNLYPSEDFNATAPVDDTSFDFAGDF